jgi:hypothetical protein
MRRFAVTVLVLIAAAVMVAAASAAVPLLAKPRATVRVKSCSLEDQSAVFYGRMRKLHGTRRMKMKFGLLERPAASRHFKRVHAPGLARWRRSAVGVRAYGYSQEVRGLQNGSVYRMRVRYRWYDKDNQLQRSARRTSRPCRMFVALANLHPRLVDTRGLGGGVWRYRVRVFNTGEAAADDIPVQLSVDGAIVETKTVSHLGPGESIRLAFDDTACTNRYSFRVDPDGTLPESNEADNRASASC